MARRNFFEVLTNVDINLYNEFKKIEELFSGYHYKIDRYESTTLIARANLFFVNWEHRQCFLDINEMRETCNILPYGIESGNKDISIENIVLYFEFVITILTLIEQPYTTDKEADLILKIFENIRYICDRYNLEIKKINNQIWIVEKSSKVTEISELYPDIADKVVEYSRLGIKGDLDRKRELLSSIALKYEGVKSSLRNGQQANLVKDIDTLLNNLHIRHNNLEGEDLKEVTVNMSNKDLEEWYDRAYDIMLLALMYNDYLEYKPDIKDLRIKCKTK